MPRIKGQTGAPHNIVADISRRPSQAEVDRLWRSHGHDAVVERWYYISPRTLQDIRNGLSPGGTGRQRERA